MRSIICEYCDSVYRCTALPHRTVARCECCDAFLYRPRVDRIDAMLALAIGAVIAFIVATTSPLVTLIGANGTVNHASLWDAVVTSYDSGVVVVAVIAATTLFLFPLLELCLYLWILLPLRAKQIPPYFVPAMHVLRVLRPWSMVEVFLLGVVVAVMKLSSVASVRPDAGVVAFAGLTVLLVALGAFDRRSLWDQVDELRS